MSRVNHSLKVRHEDKDGNPIWRDVGAMFPSHEEDWVCKLNMFPDMFLMIYKDRDSEYFTPKIRSNGKDGKHFFNPVGKMFKTRSGGFVMKLHLWPELTIMCYPFKTDGDVAIYDEAPPLEEYDEDDYTDGVPF